MRKERRERFTPGPWSVPDGRILVIEDSEGREIVSFPLAKNYDGEERIANCRLVASAPDMYALLDEVVSAPLADDWWKFRERVSAVLKKARGEA